MCILSQSRYNIVYILYRTKFVRESFNDVRNLNEIARATKLQASKLVELDTNFHMEVLLKLKLKAKCEVIKLKLNYK